MKKYLVASGLLVTVLAASCSSQAVPTSSSYPGSEQPKLNCQDPALNGPDWNTGSHVIGPVASVTGGEVNYASTNNNNCYETVTFGINATVDVGVSAQYVDILQNAVSGSPIGLLGLASLQVRIGAPGTDSVNRLAQRATDRYVAITEVQAAGTANGVSTYGIGVNAKKPFTIEVRHDNSNETEVVVHIKRQ